MRRLSGRPPALWLALLAALGILIALATAAPPAVTFRSNVGLDGPVTVARAAPNCQGLVVVPAETRAVRLTAVAGRPVPSGATLQPQGGAVIALGPPERVDRGTRVIYRLPSEIERTTLGGLLCLKATAPGTRVTGSGAAFNVDLLGAERGSWLDAIPLMADRASFGRGVVGGAALPIAFLLIVGAWILVVRTAPRGVDTIVDGRAIRSVALVAALLGCAYAVTTPPMEAPDEMVHMHYVDLLRDRHVVPRSTEAGSMSSQLDEVVNSSRVGEIVFKPSHRPPWTGVENDAINERLAKLPAHDAHDVFTNASSQPPGYYALGAVATAITGGNELDRLLVMRLLSAFLMAFGVAGAVVFARAAVPSAGGLVLCGGLLLAALPIVTFIGGSVNPDAAYTAASAWALAGIAVILRSGLTARRALWVGAATGLGLFSKLTFVPMLPVIMLAALVIAVREVRGDRGRQLVRPLLIAAGTAAVIGLPFLFWAKFSGRGIVFDGPGAAPAGPATMRELLVYSIELYVGQFGPILDRIQGSGPHIFIDGLVGRLGWTDYGLSAGWNKAFQVLWLSLTALAGVGVVRAVLRRRTAAVEIALWLVAAVPLLLVIAHSGLMTRHAGGIGFEQARYLFPLAPLGVAGVALAIKQLPTRVHGGMAAVLSVVAITQATALWLVTIGRYFA